MSPREIPEPSNSVARFGAVTLSVALVGGGIASLAAFIAAQMMKDSGNGIGDLIAAIVSLLIGYPAGVSIGIILIKKQLHWKGSVAFGIAAAFLGAGLTMIAAEPLHLNVNTQVLMSVYFLTVPVCAAGGFTLSRHGKAGVLPS